MLPHRPAQPTTKVGTQRRSVARISSIGTGCNGPRAHAFSCAERSRSRYAHGRFASEPERLRSTIFHKASLRLTLASGQRCPRVPLRTIWDSPSAPADRRRRYGVAVRGTTAAFEDRQAARAPARTSSGCGSRAKLAYTVCVIPSAEGRGAANGRGATPSRSGCFHTRMRPAGRRVVRLRNATPSVLHQRHVGRVLRPSCNPRGRRLASSRGRETQQADALLFGRVNYDMMESAWRPPAATGPDPIG